MKQLETKIIIDIYVTKVVTTLILYIGVILGYDLFLLDMSGLFFKFKS